MLVKASLKIRHNFGGPVACLLKCCWAPPLSPRRPSVILGVTNPFFAKTLQHWPHIIRIGDLKQAGTCCWERERLFCLFLIFESSLHSENEKLKWSVVFLDVLILIFFFLNGNLRNFTMTSIPISFLSGTTRFNSYIPLTLYLTFIRCNCSKAL